MSEDSHLPHILNLSNSIIGVTVLAMPFCYKECGIVLGTILLFFCSWLTLSSCQMLMKAGLSSRKRSYGFLAYYTHGSPGKIAVEVGMIGLQLGTLVAQVVIIGDLGPAIISKFTGIENNSNLRTGLIIFLCMCIGLPLGLLKNLSAISKASTLCICFYSVFVFYIVSLSVPNLIAANWYNRVNLWKTEGLFKCLPIFSFAFGCQTQLFFLYDSLVEPSLKGMTSITSSAVNMCTCAYLLVGFFGYVSFCDTDITGDIINHLPSTLVSDVLKLGFVISIAITFPLIIFPCRASLYTLLFPQRPKMNEDVEQRPVLPEIHFKVLTVCIVLTAVITGILVPNVEFVLAINGATMGTLICYIFPAMFFLRVMTGSSEGKNMAQFVFVCGFTIMLLCTYTTLNSQDKGHINIEPIKPEEIMKPSEILPIVKKEDTTLKQILKGKSPLDEKDHLKESRIEPPNPRAPVEVNYTEYMNKSASDKIDDKQKLNISMKTKKDETANQMGDTGDQIHDIKKDEKDKKGGEKMKEESLDKQSEILVELKKQHEEQQRLIDEQKKILAELKEHQEEKHKIDNEPADKHVLQKQKIIDPKGQPQQQVQQQLQHGQQKLQQGQQQLPQQPVQQQLQHGQQKLQQGQQQLPQQPVQQQLQHGQQKLQQGQQQLPQQPVQQQVKADEMNNVKQQPVIPAESQVNVQPNKNLANPMNNVDNNIKQIIQPVGGEKVVANQASKNVINSNLKIPRQAGEVKVDGKDNVDNNLRIKRDLENFLKSTDKDIKNIDKSKTKTNVNKDVNDEMKRRIM